MLRLFLLPFQGPVFQAGSVLQTRCRDRGLRSAVPLRNLKYKSQLPTTRWHFLPPFQNVEDRRQPRTTMFGNSATSETCDCAKRERVLLLAYEVTPSELLALHIMHPGVGMLVRKHSVGRILPRTKRVRLKGLGHYRIHVL